MKTFLRKVRVALTPRTRRLKTPLSNGAVVYGQNRSGYGGRGIYIFRDAIEPEFQCLERLLDPDGVFVDIGANTGIYTLKVAQHFGKHRGVVLALEPFPELLADLSYNVQANGFSNVRLRNVCAGDRCGAGVLWKNYNRPNSFSLVQRERGAAQLSVLVVKLDDLLRWEGLDRLDYLKVDAEGSEREVLAGATETLHRHRPIVQLESTLCDAPFQVPAYSCFRAGGDSPRPSPNKIYIPNESPKIDVPGKLGWAALSEP